MSKFEAKYSRKQYMNKECSHRDYYGQFVTPSTVAIVVSVIGKENILNSTDPDFNDIPLRRWDALVSRLPGSGRFVTAGDYYTQAGGVCLAKEAAQQYQDKFKTLSVEQTT